MSLNFGSFFQSINKIQIALYKLTFSGNYSIGNFSVAFYAWDPSFNNVSCSFFFEVVQMAMPSGSAASSANSVPVAPIAGAAGGAVILLVLLLLALIFSRRAARKVC